MLIGLGYIFGRMWRNNILDPSKWIGGTMEEGIMHLGSKEELVIEGYVEFESGVRMSIRFTYRIYMIVIVFSEHEIVCMKDYTIAIPDLGLGMRKPSRAAGE